MSRLYVGVYAAGHAAVSTPVEVVAVGVAASPQEAVAHECAVVEEPASMDGLAVSTSRTPVADRATTARLILGSWKRYSRVLALFLAVLAVLEVVGVLSAPEPEELLALAGAGVVEEAAVQLAARAPLQGLQTLGLQRGARGEERSYRGSPECIAATV